MFLMGTTDMKFPPLQLFALFYMELKTGLVSSSVNVGQVQVQINNVCCGTYAPNVGSSP